MTTTLQPVRNVNNGARVSRPHISKVAERFRVRRGIASDKTAAHKLDEWFRVSVDVIEAHRDVCAMDDLRKKLAPFLAALREADDNIAIAQALRAKLCADTKEDVARHDFLTNPSVETRDRFIAALRIDEARTDELLAALEVAP